MPSPVRRIAPKPRRCTEISPPSKTFPLGLSHTDRHGSSRFASRGSHEFRPDWIVNIFAKNGVDCGEVAISQGPADYLADGREMFRMTRAPKRDANTRLIEEPTDCEVNHALTIVFASECIQLACRIKVLGEMRPLKLGISGLAHVVFGKLATCVHCAA